MVRKFDQYRWEGVDVHPYKEDGTHFRSITRQTVFSGNDGFPMECRYFEIQADGYSTLERHEHQHLVMVLRGEGSVLVGDDVYRVGPNDVIHIPAMTWHQFRANQGVTFGFWCVVRADRDKPQRPANVDEVAADGPVAEFIRL